MSGPIDVCIVSYRTPELARSCHASLTDHRSYFDRIVSIDADKCGVGYGQAVNDGLRGGTAEYVVALNADTRMLEPPDAILELFESDPRIAVVGPRQIDDSGHITHAGIFGRNEQPEHRYWMEFDHGQGCERELDAITVSGSVYFARRSVWEEFGGFLETPRMFYEETFLSYLVRHAGYRVVYTGATTWEHQFAKSPGVARGELAIKSREIFRAACAREGIEC